jgi:hypothetical protein
MSHQHTCVDHPLSLFHHTATYTQVSADSLKKWVTKDAGVWIGLKGTLEAFDR